MLSVSDPSPSLLPLLLDALDKSSSFLVERGITKEAERSDWRCGDDEDLEELEIDERRRMGACDTTTFESNTEGVAGVTDGRPDELLRLGVIDESRSTFLRLGDECDECIPSIRLSAAESPRRRWIPWSKGDEVGTDEEIALPLELRDRLLPSDVLSGFGLPPRVLPERDMADVFPDKELDRLEGPELPLFLRSNEGMIDLPPPPMPRPLAGTGLPLVPRLSRAALMSGGIATWWTMLTDRQSAACIIRYSLGVGGRQHPGQPGLLYPTCFCEGLVRAH